MLKRLVLLVVVLALGLSLVGAQESTVFCGDLSADDCTLLVKSSDVMGTLQTVAFDFDVAFEMGGVEISPGMDSLVVGLNGDGALNTDLEALENFQAQLTASLVIPGDLLGMGMDELVLDLLMVDGILYLDAGPLMGMQGMSMWMGIDMTTLVEESLGMSLEDMTDMGMGGMDLSGMEGLYDENEYTTIARLADEQVMGQTVAVFETSLDFGAMFSSEGFSGIYGEVMAQALAMQGIDPDMMGMDMDTFIEAIGTMFEDMELGVQQWIGLDDYYMHYGSLYMDLTMDMNAMVAAMGLPPEPGMPAAITMTLGGELNLHDFNAALDLVAPEGAQIIDPMMFLGGMGDF